VQVTDSWDRPFYGANVVAWSLGPSSKVAARAETEDQGVAQLLLAPGVPYRLEVYGSPFDPVAVEPVYSDSAEVTVRLVANRGRISGRIVCAETSEPITHFALSWRLPNGHGGGGTGGSGEGEFDDLLEPGEGTLTVTAAGYATGARSLRLAAGEWIRNLVISLAPLACTSLMGRVVDVGGYPVAGAEVSLSALIPYGEQIWETSEGSVGEATTDESGAFRFHRVPLGGAVIHARKDGYEPTADIPFQIRGDGEALEVVLARGGRLRIRGIARDGSRRTPGMVRLRRDGALVLRAAPDGVEREVRNSSLRGTERNEFYEVWTSRSDRATVDDDGFLVIDGVPIGDLRVTAVADGLEGRATVWVVAGETLDVEVRLEDWRR
jgi:hypothetical protein